MVSIYNKTPCNKVTSENIYKDVYKNILKVSMGGVDAYKNYFSNIRKK